MRAGTNIHLIFFLKYKMGTKGDLLKAWLALNPQLNINRVYELSSPSSSSSFLISLVGWEREKVNKKSWCRKLQKIFPWLPEEEPVGKVEFIRNIWTPRQKISVKEQFSSFYWLHRVQYWPDQQKTWEFHNETWCALSDYVGPVLTPTLSPTLRKLVKEKSVQKIKEPLQEFG